MTAGTAICLDQPRRRDRAQGEEWIRQTLLEAAFGSLATVADGQPALHLNLFVFDPERDAIYLHTARQGETRSRLEAGAPVVFGVAEMGRLLPASAAVSFSVEYASVVARGTARVVEEPAEAAHALGLLMRKYAPHLDPEADYRGIDAADLARTTVYRIDIESWSGKRNAKPEAESAYAYPRVQGPAAPSAEQ